MSSENPSLQDPLMYSDGESSSEDLVKTEKQLKKDIEDITDLLPPPIPLMLKSLSPSEPLFQSQNIPFEYLPEMSLTDTSSEISKTPPSNNLKYDAGTSLRSLFPKDKLIYLRYPSLYKEKFNKNICDLKKLLIARKKREGKEEKIYSNPLLLTNISRYYKPDESDSTLVFESRFECGNLSMAAKVSENHYNLLLQNDINSKGHTQWFFFSVENTAKNLVKFTILNFAKPDSLFNEGMQLLIYSLKENEEFSNAGWKRGGSEISYYPNGIIKEGSSSLKTYFSLSFSYEFAFSQDRVFFAYSLPYTYTFLQKTLDDYENDPLRSEYFHRKTICKSIGGNNCDYLTITNKGTLNEIRNKRAVIISARVHPGETVGSWMMHGVLDFLTSNLPEADFLRSKYVFKVLPMLNPDGVINGNYRCSLVGADLNRRWKNPQSDIHPIIYNFKQLIKNTANSYDIDLICDLHGHSRKKNIFMYGCNYQKSPQTCKLFPYILSKISQIFSYEDSKFGLQRSKESTLRVSLFKELKIPNVFTLEASFCGGNSGKYANLHFSGQALVEMGKDLCKALLILNQNPALARNPVMRKPLLNQRTKANCHKKEADTDMFIVKLHSLDLILHELLAKKEALYNGEEVNSSSGSESDPSEDNLDFRELEGLIPSATSSFNRFRANRSFDFSRDKKIQKKCPRCNQDDIQGHYCKVFEAPQPRKKIVGLRTYYNLVGKMVHDQATQTPPSFYEKSPKKKYLATALDLNSEDIESDAGFPSSGISESPSKNQYFPSLNSHRRNSSTYLENSKRPMPSNLGSCGFSPRYGR